MLGLNILPVFLNSVSSMIKILRIRSDKVIFLKGELIEDSPFSLSIYGDIYSGEFIEQDSYISIQGDIIYGHEFREITEFEDSRKLEIINASYTWNDLTDDQRSDLLLNNNLSV